MKLSFWSDEERWFVPRAFGLGYSLNLKYVAKRLGWIKTSPPSAALEETAEILETHPKSTSHEDRLGAQIEASKYEEQE